MDIKTKMKDVWQRLAGVEAAAGDATMGERKTAMLPSILSPYNPAGEDGQIRIAQADCGQSAEVRRDACRASRDQRGEGQDRKHGLAGARAAWLQRCDKVGCERASWRSCGAAWRSRMHPDSFRVLFEQVIEDLLVGGFGAVEMEATGDPMRPFHLWAVDGATIQIDANWNWETWRGLAMRRRQGSWVTRRSDSSAR